MLLMGEDAASDFTSHLYHIRKERGRKNTEWGELSLPTHELRRRDYRLAGDVVTIVENLLDVVHIPVIHCRVAIDVS